MRTKSRTLFSAKWDGAAWKVDEGAEGQVPLDPPKRRIGDCIRYQYSGLIIRGTVKGVLRMNFIPGLCKLDDYETFYVVDPVDNPHEHWVREHEIVSR